MDSGRKKVMIKIIPRVDLHAISKKFVMLLYFCIKNDIELICFLYLFKLLEFILFLAMIK
jgi:hypothetical protein